MFIRGSIIFPSVALKELGHDLCCHGRRWVRHQDLTEAEERSEIAAAVASLSGLFGKAPPGWYCRYAPSANTRRLLLEHGGFLYDSDSYADELPYWVEVSGTPHLVVPYSLTNNDARFIRQGLATADDFFSYLRDSFDLLYREGETQPKMMSVGLHMRLAGHPGRAVALERFLDHVVQHSDVWVCRRTLCIAFGPAYREHRANGEKPARQIRRRGRRLQRPVSAQPRSRAGGGRLDEKARAGRPAPEEPRT